MAMQDTHGVHHYHRRRRAQLQPYPHPNKWTRMMDFLIYFVIFIGPIMTIPQIAKIWLEKNAAGISAISWASYMVAAVFWLAYAIIHDEKPLIYSSIVWIVLDICIVAGTVLYG